MPFPARVRQVGYWVITIALAWEVGFGGLSDLARLEYVRLVVARLGYPLYLLTILGVWKVLAAAALLVPRRPLLKEWAYAGCFFAFKGAAASRTAVGEPLLRLVWAAARVWIHRGLLDATTSGATVASRSRRTALSRPFQSAWMSRRCT